MARPFTVIDFSKLLPGPFCTMVLADLGLRVVRVELPHWPDMLRGHGPKAAGLGYAYWMANRGKESLCLDFRAPAGRRALDKILASADALVEGFRPGTMDKLGLGWDAVRRRFPRLVYASITGYGDSGAGSRRAGHDLNFLAEAGYFTEGAAVPPFQGADLSGALYAASGVLAALLRRGPAGRGRRVSVSMTEAAHSWLALESGFAYAVGRPPAADEAWWRGRMHPCYRLYTAKDGGRLAVAALEPPFAVAMLRHLGLERLEADVRSEEPRRMARVARALEAVFCRQPLAYWRKSFAKTDCCVTPVLTAAEARRDARARGQELSLRGQDGRRWPLQRSPVRLSGAEPAPTPPPLLGADSAAVLRRAGVSAKEIAALSKSGLLGTGK